MDDTVSTEDITLQFANRTVTIYTQTVGIFGKTINAQFTVEQVAKDELTLTDFGEIMHIIVVILFVTSVNNTIEDNDFTNRVQLYAISEGVP